MAVIRPYLAKISPSWLKREWGEKLVQGWLGTSMGDTLVEWFGLGVRAPWVREATFPPDALPVTGRERGIRRYIGESDGTYQTRLGGAWSTWENAGTKSELLNQLGLAGYPPSEMYAAHERPLWPPVDWWSQFWLVYYPGDHSWGGPHVCDEPGLVCDGGATTDSTATVSEVTLLRDVVATWKCGHEVCRSLRIVVDGILCDDGHTCDDGSTVETVGVVDIEITPIR